MRYAQIFSEAPTGFNGGSATFLSPAPTQSSLLLVFAHLRIVDLQEERLGRHNLADSLLQLTLLRQAQVDHQDEPRATARFLLSALLASCIVHAWFCSPLFKFRTIIKSARERQASCKSSDPWSHRRRVLILRGLHAHPSACFPPISNARRVRQFFLSFVCT